MKPIPPRQGTNRAILAGGELTRSVSEPGAFIPQPGNLLPAARAGLVLTIPVCASGLNGGRVITPATTVGDIRWCHSSLATRPFTPAGWHFAPVWTTPFVQIGDSAFHFWHALPSAPAKTKTSALFARQSP